MPREFSSFSVNAAKRGEVIIQLVDALEATLKAYNQLLPGIGKIACQDYANINDAPILAAKALEAVAKVGL